MIGALPVLILPFGNAGSASAPFWRRARTAWPAAAAVSVVTIGAAWLAWPLIATGFDRALLDPAGFRPLLAGRYGVYQAALLGMIFGCMIAYAALWRVSAAETFASIAAVLAGASIALLALNIRIQRVERDRGDQSTGEDAGLCRRQRRRRRGRFGAIHADAVAAGDRDRSRPLQFCAVLFIAPDGISRLADRPGNCLGVAARRAAGRRSRL